MGSGRFQDPDVKVFLLVKPSIPKSENVIGVKKKLYMICDLY